MDKNFIPLAKPDLSGNEMKYVKKCIRDNWISSAGDYVNDFEKKFSDFCNMKYGVAINSGTNALHLALEALDIGRGDEVIIPNLTFAATINAVIYTGARPVVVDVNYDDWNIKSNEIINNISNRTKAIIPVHLYGQPSEMDSIVEISNDYNLKIIEDCAEAHGAEYKDKKVGSFGDISCFSFFGNKIITTGEGGMCITDDKNLQRKLNKLREHGMSEDKKYWHDIVGYSYGMTNLQAAVGLAQLERIDSFIKNRNEIERFYTKHLKNTNGLQFQKNLSDRKKVCWMYTILINDEEYGMSNEELQKKLDCHGIDSRRFFYPLHKMDIYKRYIKDKRRFPVAEKLSKDGLVLPTFSSLKRDQIYRICRVITN